MIINQHRVLRKIDKAIGEIEREIDRPGLPDGGPWGKNTLLKVRNILERMRLNVIDPDHSDEVTDTGLGYMITDRWDFNPSLAEIIASTVNLYDEYLITIAGNPKLISK